jgi:hypothetical protein
VQCSLLGKYEIAPDMMIPCLVSGTFIALFVFHSETFTGRDRSL